MNYSRITLVALAFLVLGALPAMAQQKRASPHDTISSVVDGNRVTLIYGRPYAKGRKIWGTLVPYGKIWRTGADEATTLITQKPIKLGDLDLPAGAYTLFTLPSEDGKAKLVVSKQLGQWGLQYDEKNDLGRTDLKKESVDSPVEQFTMSVGSNKPTAGGVIKMTWESTTYSIPFTVSK